MSIMTVTTRITRRYLENKTKSDLAQMYLDLCDENERLNKWINDLQSGMFVNCVYCGHRYGPDPGTPVAMAEVLKEHVVKCPKHPMSKLRTALEDVVILANDVLSQSS
jgi:hypothetical protein